MKTRKCWILPNDKIPDISELTPSNLLRSINLNSCLELDWPFVVENDVLVKIAKISSKSEFTNVMSYIFEIASGKFQNATLLSTGPYVYNCTFYWTINQDLTFLFSINPTYCPETEIAQQYIRFDEYLQKAPPNIESLYLKANRALGDIEECDVSLPCVFDPHYWTKRGFTLPPRTLEGMVKISSKDSVTIYSPALSAFRIKEVYISKDLALSGFMQNRIATNLNRRLMDRVICPEYIDQWIDEWIELERERNKDYMKILSEEERNVIKEESNVVMMGRSGTGKTLCGLLRILAAEELFNEALEKACVPNFEEEELNYMIDPRFPPFDERRAIKYHCLFLTASYILALEVKKRYNKGIDVKRFLKYFDPTEQMANFNFEDSLKSKSTVPQSMEAIQDKHFPLFLTSRQLLVLLDSTLEKPFFHKERKSHCYIDQYMIFGARNDQGADMVDFIETIDLDIDTITNRLIEEMDSWESEDTFGSGGEIRSFKPSIKPTVSLNGIEVGFDQFKNFFWNKELDRKLKNDVSPSAVWKEICTNIKGGVNSHCFPGGYIPEKEYQRLIGPRSALTESEIKKMYSIFKEYQHWLQKNWHYDQNDLLNHILSSIKWGYRGVPFHEIICDEIQDLPPAYFLVLAIITEQKLLLAGDTAQTISEGIGFRFQDLRSTFHDFYLPVAVPKLMPLSKNYRSHKKIIDLGNSVIRIIELLFPDSIDKLKKETGTRDGIIPIIIEDEKELQHYLLGSGNKHLQLPIEFGFNQAVIVRSPEAKQKLPDYLKQRLCFTITEAKGLEFDDLIIYNFFSDSQLDESYWKLLRKLTVDSILVPTHLRPEALEKIVEQLEVKDKDLRDASRLRKKGDSKAFFHVDAKDLPPDINIKYRGLLSELKQLYTGITRARELIFFFDEDLLGKREAIEQYWRKLNFVSDFSKVHPSSREMPQPSEKIIKEGWKMQALKLFRHGVYEEAIKAFEYAGDAEGKARALAFYYASNANDMLSQSQGNRAMKDKAEYLFLQAAAIFDKLNLFSLAGRCYYTLKKYGQAAEYFHKESDKLLEKAKKEKSQELVKSSNAMSNMEARCYLILGKLSEAKTLYYKLQNWPLYSRLLCELQQYKELEVFLNEHPECAEYSKKQITNLLRKNHSLAVLEKEFNKKHISNIFFYMSLFSPNLRSSIPRYKDKYFQDLKGDVPCDATNSYFIVTINKKNLPRSFFHDLKEALESFGLRDLVFYLALYFEQYSEIFYSVFGKLIEAHNIILKPQLSNEKRLDIMNKAIIVTKNNLYKNSIFNSNCEALQREIFTTSIYLGIGLSPLQLIPSRPNSLNTEDIFRKLDQPFSEDDPLLPAKYCHLLQYSQKNEFLFERIYNLSAQQWETSLMLLNKLLKIINNSSIQPYSYEWKNLHYILSLFEVSLVDLPNNPRFCQNYVIVENPKIKYETNMQCEKIQYKIRKMQQEIRKGFEPDEESELDVESQLEQFYNKCFLKCVMVGQPFTYYTENYKQFFTPYELASRVIFMKILGYIGTILVRMFQEKQYYYTSSHQTIIFSLNHFNSLRIIRDIFWISDPSDILELQKYTAELFAMVDLYILICNSNVGITTQAKKFKNKRLTQSEQEIINMSSVLERVHNNLYMRMELYSLILFQKFPNTNLNLIDGIFRKAEQQIKLLRTSKYIFDPLFSLQYLFSDLTTVNDFLYAFPTGGEKNYSEIFKFYKIMELYSNGRYEKYVWKLCNFLIKREEFLSFHYFNILTEKAITSLLYIFAHCYKITSIFLPLPLFKHVQNIKITIAEIWKGHLEEKQTSELFLLIQRLLNLLSNKVYEQVKQKKKKDMDDPAKEMFWYVYQLFSCTLINYPMKWLRDPLHTKFFTKFIVDLNKFAKSYDISVELPVQDFEEGSISKTQDKYIIYRKIPDPFCYKDISIAPAFIQQDLLPDVQAEEKSIAKIVSCSDDKSAISESRIKAITFLSKSVKELESLVEFQKIKARRTKAVFFAPLNILTNYQISNRSELDDLIYYSKKGTEENLDELKSIFIKKATSQMLEYIIFENIG